jgi:hypothetical protein
MTVPIPHHQPSFTDTARGAPGARVVALLVLLVVIAAAVVVPPPADATDRPPPGPILADPDHRASVSATPGLDWSLQQLTDGDDEGAAEPAVEPSGLAIERGKVEVVIEARPGALPAARRAAAAAGAVETGSYRQLLRVWVSPADMEDLAADPAVRSIRPPDRPVILDDGTTSHAAQDLLEPEVAVRLAGSVVSQGVAETRAAALHRQGIDGTGVKVGIIDAGFAGYRSLLGTELPPSVVTWGRSVLGPEGGTGEVHGTAVAEVVHDMAPGAQLYLAQIADVIEVGNAAAWMRAQGVDVINMSLGFFGEPGDGTGVINEIVTQTVRSGDVFWANAAGNHRRKHWGGNYRSWESSPWHDWTGGNVPLQQFTAAAGAQVQGVLTWGDDWAAARQDYDLCILRDNGSEWEPVVCSENVQNGSPGQQPVEALQGQVLVSGTYAWAIWRERATRTDVDFDFFDLSRDLQHQVRRRSTVSPADNRTDGFMAAAAVLRSPGFAQATYSSEGPTRDGRLTPQVSAPAEVATVTYGSFTGTSAASPHLAGAAALVRHAQPTFSAAHVRSHLEATAVDLGPIGPDPQFGHGRMALGAEPPYVPVTPERLLDTRDGTGGVSRPVGERQTVTTTVAGRGGIPSNATAVAINITAVSPTRDGYLTVWPAGRSRPTVSSINFPARAVVGNFVIAQLGTDGKLAIYNHNGATNVVFDVVGYLPASSGYTPVTPARVLDTRDGTGGLTQPVGERQTVTTTVAGRGGIPSNATAVAINITAVSPTRDGYLTVWPAGRTRPTVSSINFPARAVVGNFVIAQLGTDGKLAIYNHNGATNVVFDVVGYYTRGSG